MSGEWGVTEDRVARQGLSEVTLELRRVSDGHNLGEERSLTEHTDPKAGICLAG